MGWKVRATAAAAMASAMIATGIGTAGASPAWAPSDTAPIHPGVVVKMAGVDCIAGFVLQQRHQIFVAVPASCASAGPGEAQDGCASSQLPIGLAVHVQGARHDAKIAYSSWVQMQLHSVTASRRCHTTPLVLVRLARRDRKRVNPSIPLVGGPEGVSSAAPTAPASLTLYLENAAATATAVSTTAGGWKHTMVVNGAVPTTAAGSPVLTSSGRAIGMVSVVPPSGSSAGPTDVHDLRLELQALRHTHGFHHVHLVAGTTKYQGA